MANPWAAIIERARKQKAKRMGLRSIIAKSNFGKRRIVQSNIFKASQLSVFRKFFR